jgi:AcrR family transcriptional regulator
MQQAAISRHDEGLRERKRRETLQRISEVGLKLFLAKGYDATTLDEIAAEAGISRRTFFYYFKSKDEIILAYIAGFAEALKTEIKESTTSNSPLDTVRDAMVKLAGRYETPELLPISRFMRDSDARHVKRQNNMLFEQAIFEALCEVWPAKSRRNRLRLVAMASIGAKRVAVDSWYEQNGKRSLPSYLREAFNDLRAEMSAKD